MSFAMPSPLRLRTRDNPSVLEKETSKRSKFCGGSTSYNTPYKSRNRTTNITHRSDDDIKKATKNLKRFVGKKWLAFQVSPLYNWDNSDTSMKRYGRRLKEKLMARISDESTTEYEVSYSVVPRLKLNEIDHEAIEVTVFKISENEVRSVAYNGFFLSWGATETMHHKDSTVLPFLLCHGLQNLVRQLHTEFQFLHDCIINPVSMHDEELRRLTVGSFAYSTYEENHLISLECLPLKSKSGFLRVTIPTVVLSKLWAGIHDSSLKDFKDDQVSAFWNDLYHHIQRSFGLDLRRCGWGKIILPDVSFTQDSVLVKRKEQMYVFLTFLGGLRSSTIDSVAPNIHEIVLD